MKSFGSCKYSKWGKERREEGGGRGAGWFFPCRISSGVGKAGALENTVSLDLVSL